MSSIINDMVFAQVVNLGTSRCGPVRHEFTPGVASTARVVTIGAQLPGMIAMTSGSEIFELNDPLVQEISHIAATAFPGSELGVETRSSSLAEGHIVAGLSDEGWRNAVRLGKLVPSSNSPDHLFSETFANLIVGMNGDVDVYSFSTYARPQLGVPNSVTVIEIDKIQIVSDGVYQGMEAGAAVVLEHDQGMFVTQVSDVFIETVLLESISIPATILQFSGVFGLIANKKQSLKIWFNPVPAARLVRLPATQVTYDQILATTNAPPDAIILDATDTVITPGYQNAIPPIRVLRNLAKATRGRTVRDEVIGSGDASKSFQSFQLAKSPLTYLPDPLAPKGLRNTLEVFVDGQKWRQAPSFYGAKPSDAIYVVRHDEDHETFVVFGDGELGRRLPTGVDNVVATYRYGVGGNVPANSITTLEKPIKGVRKIFNPLPATGGKEPPTREQLRREAPLSTLVLGRCISLLDFEAEARRFGNVVNAKARWGWDDAGETAVVNVWCSTRDAGDPSATLGTYLAGLAEPGIALHVAKATPSVRVLRIELAIDPRFRAQEVELDVARHLFHDFDGILSTRNAVIGGPLVRSQVHAAIHAIPGVLGIDTLTLDGVELPNILTMPNESTYLDLEHADMTVGSTAAGLQLFGNP